MKAYTHYPLTPLIHKWVTGLTEERNLLFEAIEQYQSPINIQHTKPFKENIKGYIEVFEKYGLDYKIFFARKANKSRCFVRKAAKLNQGVDTASYRELAQALELGLNKEHLISTAAVKNKKLISLCVANHIPIIIDNLDECKLIQAVSEELNANATVIVRLSGFQYVGNTLPTRFGFHLGEATEFIESSFGEAGIFNRLTYSGLHFHLNGYSISQRGECLLQSIKLIDSLNEKGIETKSLDFGGGILMNYLQDKNQYAAFMQGLKASVLHQIPAITYQHDPLGMVILEGTIYGEPTVYPYYNEVNKASFLDEVLNYKNDQGQPIHELIKVRNLQIRIEPGRSALDQAGITVAKVAFRRKDTDGEWLFGLEMNRTQLKSGSSDFLLDPIHVPKFKSENPEKTYGYLVGAYCLEQEQLLKRKIEFDQFPEVGDLIVFVNTAGYMMHFYESEAHLFELAENLVYHSDSHTFTLDEETKALSQET
ncbi:hypothetical protein [Sphingobacterium hungaricum]|uniref:Diaminopimelate decarboxylase n=1 Tax=Sphingobacterium hungaricum TaxID=2082723 RepID=A0A928YSE0_9SPHI|nr:hypothetical protein [Sphingobacterium hungaricum]MBE8715155.1 diaminopimelate decarboxylase [Sphingobacterium hungaricum]